MHATTQALVIGGALAPAADGAAAARRPASFYLGQVRPQVPHCRPTCMLAFGRCGAALHTVIPAPRSWQAEALARALPREFVPSELVAREALVDAVEEAAAAAGACDAAAGRPLDCLEACCLQDELHLFRWGLDRRAAPLLLQCQRGSGWRACFHYQPPSCSCSPCCCSPAGPTGSLLAWARLPLPLLQDGGQVGRWAGLSGRRLVLGRPVLPACQGDPCGLHNRCALCSLPTACATTACPRRCCNWRPTGEALLPPAAKCNSACTAACCCLLAGEGLAVFIAWACRCAASGWDSCLWHANLPILAARSGAPRCLPGGRLRA